MIGTPGRELTTIARRVTWLRVRGMKSAVGLVVVVAGLIIAGFGLVPLITLSPPYLRGLVAGFAVAALVFGLVWYAVLGDASMTWRVGALGEHWTSEELQLLGPGWTVMNNLRIPGVDGSEREIDHVLVGPGGVLVVDSKLWPSKRRQLSTSDSPDINKAAIGAIRQSGVVRLCLSGLVTAEAVSAHVIFWGADLSSAGDSVLTTRDGDRLLHGRDIRAWRYSVSSNMCLDSLGVDAAVARLRPHLVPEQRLRHARPPRGWTRPLSR